MSLTLRPYQVDLVDRTRTLMQRGERAICIQAPTGSGKTALTAHMLGAAVKKGIRAWFCVHRRELVLQSVKAFDNAGVPHGLVAAGFGADPKKPIQIASIQTLARRWHTLVSPRLIVVDECHHVAAAGWAGLLARFPDAYVIGLTATPERLDGRGLDAWFSAMVCGPTTAELIASGYLAPYRVYVPSTPDLAGVHTRMGDYVASDLSAALDKPTITGCAIQHYLKYAPGRRAVAFCASVQHSQHVAAQFNAAGVVAAHVDGETPTDARDDAVQRFATGEIKVLCNVELFGEGFDLPALEAAILLRPTQSLGLYLQQVGRALRPAPGKAAAIILDHAGNCLRHGLPDDERVWALEGREIKRRDAGSPPSVRVCPNCFHAQASGRSSCSACGVTFEIESRQVDEVDGELVEVQRVLQQQHMKRAQGMAHTREQLLAIAVQRRYKNPHGWVHVILQARQRKKLARGQPVHA